MSQPIRDEIDRVLAARYGFTDEELDFIPSTQLRAGNYDIKYRMVDGSVKNAGVGFAIPYLHNGQPHDYVPDFIVTLKTAPPMHLVLETKGFNPLAETKAGATKRWVDAVTADGTYGKWAYAMVRQMSEVNEAVTKAVHPFDA
ncbi:MAG: hypothetical protein U1E51_19450 [Candidatus Binatia bacterium]|nr:hypothetical protein [Candidatus Binatia bacterium]